MVLREVTQVSIKNPKLLVRFENTSCALIGVKVYIEFPINKSHRAVVHANGSDTESFVFLKTSDFSNEMNDPLA